MAEAAKKVVAERRIITRAQADQIRANAVALFRSLASRLESGELRAARVQWREGLAHAEVVEVVGATATSKGHAKFVRVELLDG